MKILLVSDHSVPVGGAEVALLNLRDGLRRRGHDARLFASSAFSPAAGAPADYECFGTASRFRTLLQTANPAAYWTLRRVLADFGPDVVHVKLFLTQLSPLILPVLRNVPSLCHVVWYRPICPLGTKTLPDGSACRFAAGKACYDNRCLPLRDWLPLMLQMKLWRRWRSSFNLIVANSEATKRSLLEAGFDRVAVLRNGVPVQPARPRLAAPRTVVYAGRLVRVKGVDVLLKAFAAVVARIPEARLVLAGDGPERQAVEVLVRRLGLSPRVSLTGYLPRGDIEDLFTCAWVQVVPSLWAEPFGIVAIEAMMRGTAVVASDTGGLAEIVRHGETGLLVAPGDETGLANALLRILESPELAAAMGEAGRRVALAEFTEATYVERFTAIYRMLASGRAEEVFAQSIGAPLASGRNICG